MHTTSRIFAVTLLAFASATASAGHRATVVRAHTVDEIVAAMQKANSTGRPTIIRVARGHYRPTLGFSSPGLGSSRFPAVTGTIAIEGHDVDDTDFTLDGGRAFLVAPGGRLTLSDIAVTGGSGSCDEMCSYNGGGAVLNAEGVLWIERSEFSRNFAPADDVASGGAILSVRGHLHVEDTTIERNAASIGGGIAVVDGTATIRHSIIRGNFLGAGFGNGGSLIGGGLYVGGAKVTIVDSTFSANEAGYPEDDWLGFGGAIFNRGTVWMKNSSLVENTAIPYGFGGAIDNQGSMQIENTTIGANSAGTIGGAVFNGGSLTLRGVTIARNEVWGAVLRSGEGTQSSFPPGCSVATPELCIVGGGGIWNEPGATVQTANSVLASNTGPISHGGPTFSDCHGTLISKGRNAIGSDAECVLDRQGDTSWYAEDLTNLDVKLGALQDDGRAGKAVVPLLANSPVIDQGGRVWDRCTPLDQLGHYRSDGDADGRLRCDIGAVEFIAPSP